MGSTVKTKLESLHDPLKLPPIAKGSGNREAIPPILNSATPSQLPGGITSGIKFPLTELSRDTDYVTIPLAYTSGVISIEVERIKSLSVADGNGAIGDIIFNPPDL